MLFRSVNGVVCESGVQLYGHEGGMELDDGVVIMDRRRCVQQCGSAQAFGGFIRTVICLSWKFGSTTVSNETLPGNCHPW